PTSLPLFESLVLVLPLHRLPVSNRDRLVPKFRRAASPVRHGMRQEPLIIAYGKIRARVTAAGFLSRKARSEQYLRQIEHVFRLQRLHKIGVVDAALVLDGDSLEPLLQFGN